MRCSRSVFQLLITVEFALCLCSVFSGVKGAWPLADDGNVCRSECLRKHRSLRYYCTTNLETYWRQVTTCNPDNAANDGNLVLSDNYGLFCKDDCSKHTSSYNWCNTLKGWDYCDPSKTNLVAQHITRWGEYCTGPCMKHGGTDYYWCRRGHAYDSVDDWDYCSPNIGLTRYELRCKPNHPCAKHEGKNYYWCYVEQNSWGWSWDYCSPPFDRIELLRNVDFDGNFGLNDIFDEDLFKRGLGGNVERVVPIGSPYPGWWQGYPTLYRILANGVSRSNRDTDSRVIRSDFRSEFVDIRSRSLDELSPSNQYVERPPLTMRNQVLAHVGENPSETPWISTSYNLQTQEIVIRSHFRRFPNVGNVYLAVIDARYLGRMSPIVNLGHRATRDGILGINTRANNFARVWDEVLVYWSIPGRAIRSIRRYERVGGQNDFTVAVREFPNPGYRSGSSETNVSIENFEDEDQYDHSNYPTP